MKISEKINFNPKSRSWLEIDFDAIASNVRILKQWIAAAKLMAVVKADGYGHGLIPTAQACVAGGAEMLGIAAVEEGIALREAGFTVPIALICPACPHDAPLIVAYDLMASVGDDAILQALAAAGAEQNKSPRVFLEIDSGMGRSGVLCADAERLWREVQEMNVTVTGLTTHFADADNPDTTYSHYQRDAFEQIRLRLQSFRSAEFEEVSISASHAMMRFGAAGGTIVRPGLLIYGVVPEMNVDSPGGLRPALTLKTRIATIRELPVGHNISYGLTHRLHRASRVATVLIGYADGYPRRLSNVGSMLVHGRHAPVLGRISMDQTVIDVTEIPEAAAGDEVVCIGTQGEQSITVQQIARQIGSIEHEVLTAFSPRVHRVSLPVQTC